MKKARLLSRSILLVYFGLVMTLPQAFGQVTNWKDHASGIPHPLSGDFTINDEADLAQLAIDVNGGHTFDGQTVTLTKDLNLSSHNWTPIGVYVQSAGSPFKGIFQGNGHMISGIIVDETSAESHYGAGLFGFISGNAGIYDLILDNVNVTGTGKSSTTGALAGRAENNSDGKMQIINCHVKNGSIQGSGTTFSYTGGLIGYLYGYWEITRCSNAVNITGVDVSYGQSTGGIVGIATNYGGNSFLSNCANTGDVKGGKISSSNDKPAIGGIVGVVTNSFNHTVNVSNCYSNATITASKESYTGGLVGYLDNTYDIDVTISNSCAAGTIDGSQATDPVIGGIVGNIENNNKTTVKNNLALQSSITGTAGTGAINRIAGKNTNGLLSGNYANIPLGTWSASSGVLYGTNVEDSRLYLQNILFYKNTLKWDFNIWHLPVGTSLPMVSTLGFAKGDGSLTAPYIICNRSQFEALAMDVNGGTSYDGIYFRLEPSEGDGSTLDLSGNEWTPVGLYMNNNFTTMNRPFEGIFDGNGKTITGLTIDGNNSSSNPSTAVGLFGYMDGNAQVKDLTFSDVDIKGRDAKSDDATNFYAKRDPYTGTLAGKIDMSNGMQITNCHVTGGTVTGGDGDFSFTGGLVGQMGITGGDGGIAYSSNAATVTGGNGENHSRTGGIVADITISNHTFTISECYNRGDIQGGDASATDNPQGYSITAGIVGLGNTHSNGKIDIKNCYSDSDITVSTVARYIQTGGITGYLTAYNPQQVMISNCYAAGSILDNGAGSPSTGGISGYLEGNGTQISNSLSIQNSVTGTGNWVNRILGMNDNTVLSGNYAYIPGMTSVNQPNGIKGDNWSGLMTSSPMENNWDGLAIWEIDPTHKIMPKLKNIPDNLQTAISNPCMKVDVKFDTQGGPTVADAQGIALDAKVPEPSNPVRPGYTFGGWYCEYTCINGWDFTNDVITMDHITNGITLYAKWISKPVPPVPPVDPVLHTVKIPQVEGANTYPAAGEHQVAKGSIMTLLVFLSDEYDQSDVYLLANEDRIDSEESKLRAMAYTFHIPVSTDTEVEVVGVKENNPIGIAEGAKAESPKVWTSPGCIHVSRYAVSGTENAERNTQNALRIYTINGKLVINEPYHVQRTTYRYNVPAGLYLVVVDDTVVKVMVNDK